jgi:hypothetical protein
VSYAREERLRIRTLQQEAKLPWTFEEALEFLRPLEAPLRMSGFGLALGGSVLTKGKSDKDLDIVVFPLDSGLYDIRRARVCFHKAGMEQLWDHYDVLRFWHQGNPACTDDKHVEVWAWHNHRIDVFFLR